MPEAQNPLGGIGAILLAAGGSARMGRPKQLLTLGGETLIRHAAKAALESGCMPVIAVLGASAGAVLAEIRGLAVMTIENENWSAGIGSSLRAGMTALRAKAPEIAGAVVLLCDQPHLSADVIGKLVSAWHASGKSMAASAYAGAIGPPCCFARSTFLEFQTLADADGAKRLLMVDLSSVCAVDWAEGAIDLDTPEDLRRARPS